MNDLLHARALQRTGFWGAQAAGCIFLARDTGRFLLAHRSRRVQEPGTWGTWGGAIDPGESPEQAALREVEQEVGTVELLDLPKLLVFRSGTFAYHNHLVIVPREFAPVLNWEAQGFRWVFWGEWAAPMHFGLHALISDPSSAKVLRDAARVRQARQCGSSPEV
jgi:8-oxo-dGTP pyrophosphatase MutT (NUDIX family)